MTKIKEIINYLEAFAPPGLQEDYDNSGLITGNEEEDVQGVLISLDCTEKIVDEAIEKGCNLIVAHHPVIFRGLKSLTGSNYVERTVIQAIKNNISIYALHTNLDNVSLGVNRKIAEILELKNCEILLPKKDTLMKIVCFVPQTNTREVLDALNSAGAGHIGNYTNCSFRLTGTGTFKPNEKANPRIGKRGELEEVKEDRLELIFPSHLKSTILKAMKESHPYEEAAYYVHKLENENQDAGSGMIGQLDTAMEQKDFLQFLKSRMDLNTIRYTSEFKGKIQTVAICGGAGSFLLSRAIRSKADVFITGDFKYHEFFDAENKIMVADIGHYESEVFTKELIYEVLTEKFTKFALHLSKIITNPVSYF